MRLKAIKPLRYATRQLVPGDVFEARSPRDYKLLLGTKKVQAHREEAVVPPPPPAVAAKITDHMEELRAARVEYTEVTGKSPFNGWSTEKLRELIAAAKQGG